MGSVPLSTGQEMTSFFWLTLTLVSFVVAGVREEMWRGGTLAGLRALWPRAFGSLGGQIAAVTLIAVIFDAGHLRRHHVCPGPFRPAKVRASALVS